MTIDWKKIVEQAGKNTDERLKNEIAGLTSLNDEEITTLINETGMNKEELQNAILAVRQASKSNQVKAEAIRSIAKGSEVVIRILSKIV